MNNLPIETYESVVQQRDALEKKLSDVVAENVALKASQSEIYDYTQQFTSSDDREMWNAMHDIYKLSSPLETPATATYLAEVLAGAIPDGYKLIPEQMYLDAEDIQAICMQCGDGNKKGYGEFVDGIFWVGELSNDEGVIKYGLNVADANYPEEGSITVFEFDKPSFAAPLRKGINDAQ